MVAREESTGIRGRYQPIGLVTTCMFANQAARGGGVCDDDITNSLWIWLDSSTFCYKHHDQICTEHHIIRLVAYRCVEMIVPLPFYRDSRDQD